VRRLLHENVWALADQALISATNFATVVILARALAPREFGVFVLVYTALLFVNGLQTGLITQPHNVLGQGRTGGDYRRYTRSSAAGQGLFSLAAALVALAVALAAYAAGLAAADVLFAAVPALVAWQLQEFTRRVLYTENRLETAFAIDVLGYGGQVALILALVAADRASGANALYAVAVASSAGALVGGWAIRASLRGRVERSYLAENWEFGKWLGAAIAASWLSGHLFFYLTAVIVNTSATAGLKASQTVLGPLNAFLLFIVTILPIRLAAARERDESVGVGLRLAYLASAPFVWAYCALVAVFAGPILDTLYGDAYAGYVDAVRLFAVYYVVIHAAYVLSSALSATHLTRPLFTGNLRAAIVGIAVGWPLIARWEVNGAVAAMILTAVVLAVAFWNSYRRSVEPDPVASPPLGEDPSVVVVVLNHNGLADTEACLASLGALDYPHAQVVVVDNASTDGSAERLRAAFPAATVIETSTNLGFGGGCNVGIREAFERGADLVWLLNNDAVVEPGALTELVGAAASDPSVGIVGSAVYRFDDRARIESWGGSTYNGLLGLPSAATAPIPAAELAFISGVSMLVRRDTLEEIGLFDETYFAYMEDADICRRAVRRGWRLGVAPGSVVYHRSGWTINEGSSVRSPLADRSQAYAGGVFLGKHAGWAILVAAPLRLAGMVVRRIQRRQIRSIPTVAGSFLSGLRVGLRGGAEPPAP